MVIVVYNASHCGSDNGAAVNRLHREWEMTGFISDAEGELIKRQSLRATCSACSLNFVHSIFRCKSKHSIMSNARSTIVSSIQWTRCDDLTQLRA